MNGPQARLTPVTFDRFVFDPASRTLLRDGRPVALAGKAFDLLSVLVAGRGAALSREELYACLWPTGIVEDGNLTQTVYLLRRALDPKGDGRRFIETLPRFGYRFLKLVDDVREQQPAARRFRSSVRAAAFAAAVILAFGASAVQPMTAALSPPASVSYALGLYHVNLRSPDHLRHGVVYFRKTVQDAPQSPLGYAGLAAAYGLQAEFERNGSPAFTRDVELAKRYRDRALAQGKGNAEALAVAAFIAYRFDDNPALAEREFRRAFAADPRNATAHHWHAILLFSQGAIDTAREEWELAHQLDPTSEVISRWLGRVYYYQRRPDDAIRALSETLMIQPSDAPALLALASAQEQRGHLHDALQTLETVRRRLPDQGTIAIPDEARVRLLLRPGARDPRTFARINRLVANRRLDAGEAALFYISLGFRERALAVLRGSRPKSQIAAVMQKFDPRFDTVRTDPRFRKFFE